MLVCSSQCMIGLFPRPGPAAVEQTALTGCSWLMQACWSENGIGELSFPLTSYRKQGSTLSLHVMHFQVFQVQVICS